MAWIKVMPPADPPAAGGAKTASRFLHEALPIKYNERALNLMGNRTGDSLMSQTGQTSATFTPFQWLQTRVAEAHWRWKVWKQLSMADPADPQGSEDWLRIQNTTAPVFFATLREILLDDVIMSVAKLADPAESPVRGGPRRNLSLKAIALDESGKLDAGRTARAEALIVAFFKASEPLITWRKWKVAHDDYLVATGTESLPQVTISDIEQALKGAVEIMTLLDAKSDTDTYGYEGMIAHGDGDSLKYALRMADQYRKECFAIGVRPLSEAAKAARAPVT